MWQRSILKPELDHGHIWNLLLPKGFDIKVSIPTDHQPNRTTTFTGRLLFIPPVWVRRLKLELES